MAKTTLISFFFSMLVFLTSCTQNQNGIKEVKLIPTKAGQEFQYIDQEGRIAINPQFNQATVFRDGMALVQTSGDIPKWGFIGEDGKFLISANYTNATTFNENLAWVVSENSAPSVINTKGEVQFTLQSAEYVRIFNNGLAAFSKMASDGKMQWGFVDNQGNIKINAQFLAVGDFSEDKCAVCNNNNKWGYIDKQGKLIVNYQFSDAKRFTNGKAVVASGGKYGVIDDNGKYLVNPQFDDMQGDGNLFIIQQGRKFGWADKDGKIVINPQFVEALPFAGNKTAAVKSTDSWGYIDHDGKIIINPQFDKAFPFNGSLALVVAANKIGFINSDGKYIINPQFDDAPIDLVQYYQNGNTVFNSVETNFFDLKAVTSSLTLDKPEGLTFDTPISVILSKFGINSEHIDKMANQNPLITAKKISNDATLYFYFYGNPWVSYQAQQGSGWNQYNATFYKFDNNVKPTGFMYVINLFNRGAGKETIIKNELEKGLSGYVKDINASVGSGTFYRNSNQTVEITINNGSIMVNIFPGGKEVMNKATDSTKVDSAKMTQADNNG